MQSRVYQFIVGIEQSTQPDPGTPSADADVVPYGWLTDNYSQVVESGPHSITDGQAAANLTGETFDADTYQSVNIEAQIVRGTTVVSLFNFSLHNVNGTWQLITGDTRQPVAHGVTFSITQATTVAQLRAAASSGPGDGTIKLKKRYFNV